MKWKSTPGHTTEADIAHYKEVADRYYKKRKEKRRRLKKLSTGKS